MKRFASLALSSVFAFAACADDKTTPETGFEIQVAPLELPGIFDACYGITVDNGTETVWSETGICASQFGDGIGSITYIGTCDADGGTPENPVDNTVSLVLEGLYVADDGNIADGGADDDNDPDELSPPGDYFNPCPDTDPCQLTRPCVENQDTLVEFNITVMRAARQGFFDIAVNFSDVFCSAKFDCAYPDADGDGPDRAIELLFNADGERADTAVLGFACTAGDPTALELGETYMYMDDIVIQCFDGSGNVMVNETLATAAGANGPGNQLDADEEETNNAYEGVFQYAVYQGAEFVNESFRKYYWNIAIGFDMAEIEDWDCNLTTMATASDALANGDQGLPNNTTLAGTTYPYLVWDIDLKGAGETALSCGQNPVGETGSGVQPAYTQIPSGTESFDNCGTGDASTFATVAGPCNESGE